MQCQSCDALLPSHAKHCPYCGVRVVEAASSPVVQSDDRERLADVHPCTAASLATSAPQSYEQVAYKPPEPAQASSYTPRIVIYPVRVSPSPARWQGKGMSRGLMLILVVLALVIIASGVGLIYYSTVYRPNQLHMQATSTVQAIQTQHARGTATAESQVTATAKATATVQAQATANAQATVTALQNIYTSATKGTPVLDDSLASNSGSGWDEDIAVGGGGCAFSSGSYHASLYKAGFYFPCIARNTNFGNFAFQVQMTIIKGDNGGLIFRGDGSTTKFYAFRVDTNGVYDLFSTQDSNHSTELAYGNSFSFKKSAGQANLLTIIARNSSIYFYINKQYVGNIADSTYQSGQIGFLAEDRTNPTDISFNNAQVWKL